MNKAKLLILLGFLLFAVAPASFAQSQANPQQSQAVEEDENYKAAKLLNIYKNKLEMDVYLPGFKATGTPSVDLQNYEAAKTKLASLSKNGSSFQDYLPIPGFTYTGNPVKDGKAYDAAKEAWVEANPEKYNALIQKKMQFPNLQK